MARYASKKVQREFQKKYGQYRNEPHQSKAKEGEVTIDRQPQKKPGNGKKVGEYIDFEEID